MISVVLLVVLLSCNAHEDDYDLSTYYEVTTHYYDVTTNYDVSTTEKANSTRKAWSYDHEESWPGEVCHSGTRQSPIDINADRVFVDWDQKYIQGPLEFQGYKAVLMSAVNNGITIQFFSEGEPPVHPVLTGGPLRNYYRLEQLHFHWLSEHAFNGRKYPLEIHFVHVRIDLSVSEALQTKDGLAIIAVMCNVNSFFTNSEKGQLHEVMQLMTRLKKPGNRLSGLLMDLTKILSPGQENYYAYDGSLSSPECNEAVIWIVYTQPLLISAHQLRQFTQSHTNRNYRSLQPIINQRVYSPRPRSVWKKPDMLTAVKDFFSTVGSFFSGLKSKAEASYDTMKTKSRQIQPDTFFSD